MAVARADSASKLGDGETVKLRPSKNDARRRKERLRSKSSSITGHTTARVRRSSSSPTWPHLRLRVMTAMSPPNEGSFAMDERVMRRAAGSGNLQLVQWLRANGCPWDAGTCWVAVQKGHVEVLRWARENGCPWRVQDRDEAAEKLGYTDDLGNLV